MKNVAKVLTVGFMILAFVVPSVYAAGVIPSPNEAKWGKIPEKVVPNKGAKYTLITASLHPSPHPEDMAFRFFHRRVEELTQSKVTTNYYPDGVLAPGGARDLLDQVRKGDVHVTRLDGSAVISISKPFEITNGLFLFDNPHHIYRFMETDAYQKKIMADFDKAGLTGFGAFSFARHVYTTKTPILGLSDLKGLKIRTMEIPSVMAAWNALGANATPLPWGDLFNALQTGLVGGGEGSATAFYAAKLYEVAKNFTAIYYKYSSIYYVMNQKTLNKLPQDLRKAVIQAGQESVELTREIYIDWEKDVFDFIKKQGVKVFSNEGIKDYPNWRKVISDAKVNDKILSRAGQEFKQIVEETRQ